MIYLYKYSDKKEEKIIINTNGSNRIPFISYEIKNDSGDIKKIDVSDIYYESSEYINKDFKLYRYNLQKGTYYKTTSDFLGGDKFIKTDTYKNKGGVVSKKINFSVGDHIINFKQKKDV